MGENKYIKRINYVIETETEMKPGFYMRQIPFPERKPGWIGGGYVTLRDASFFPSNHHRRRWFNHSATMSNPNSVLLQRICGGSLTKTYEVAQELFNIASVKTGQGSGHNLGANAVSLPAICAILASQRYVRF